MVKTIKGLDVSFDNKINFFEQLDHLVFNTKASFYFQSNTYLISFEGVAIQLS